MSRIKLDKMDHSFKHQVAKQPGGEGIRACFACKACSAACPIEAVDKRYDPRKIIRMVLLGMKQKVLESEFIWFCSSCYSCHEVCPQNVRFTDVMFAIRNLAVAEGCLPPAVAGQKNLLKQHGRLYEVTDFENEKREQMGLPPIKEYAEDYNELL